MPYYLLEDFLVRGSLEDKIKKAASFEYPKEMCGVITNSNEFIKCTNIHDDPENNFLIRPQDLDSIGWDNIKYIVHSHPKTTAKPSRVDIEQCNTGEFPWLIVSLIESDLQLITPNNTIPNLEGRPFIHRVFDCFSLVRDFYLKEFKVQIKDVKREYNWWKQEQVDLFTTEAEKIGFVEIDTPTYGDMVVLSYFSDKPNHAAIYLGNNLILHQVGLYPSRVEPYSEYWRERTRWIMRHRNLLK